MPQCVHGLQLPNRKPNALAWGTLSCLDQPGQQLQFWLQLPLQCAKGARAVAEDTINLLECAQPLTSALQAKGQASMQGRGTAGREFQRRHTCQGGCRLPRTPVLAHNALGVPVPDLGPVRSALPYLTSSLAGYRKAGKATHCPHITTYWRWPCKPWRTIHDK